MAVSFFFSFLFFYHNLETYWSWFYWESLSSTFEWSNLYICLRSTLISAGGFAHCCAVRWKGGKTLYCPRLVTIWKDHKKRQWGTGHEWGFHLLKVPCQAGFPKKSISNLRSGDSRLLCALGTQLCSVGNFAFCSADLLLKVSPHGHLGT